MTIEKNNWLVLFDNHRFCNDINISVYIYLDNNFFVKIRNSIESAFFGSLYIWKG